MIEPTAEILLARLADPFGSFPALLADWATVHPQTPALADETETIDWLTLADRVERLAVRLQRDGLKRGQAVAILGASGVAYALTYLAAIRAGGCAAPLTTSASPAQLAGMLADSGAIHLFIDRARQAELEEAAEFAIPPGVTTLLLDDLDAAMAPPGTVAASFEPQEDDRFNIIYSSGTTGAPKGIVHSHGMRWRQVGFRAATSYGPDARSLLSTPLYSNTTLVTFLPTLFAGGFASIMGKFTTGEWLRLAEERRITHAMLVPVQYQRLLADPALDKTDLSSLKAKFCTSAPFPADLKREVLRRIPGGLTEYYGMTEGGVSCVLHAHDFPDKLHTVGQPAPGHELKVIDEDGNELSPGAAGELVGRSPTMMLGYHNQPEKTREGYWLDGDGRTWQRMGDVGRVDRDGFVELVGRTKDVIISGGFNIYPVDLEAELLKDPRVAEAAVIGVPSEQWGETPVGFVVLHGADEAALEEIRIAANARLGKTQRLSALHAIAEMPRSHIGKLLKSELRELVAA